ncbi:adenosylcobinamide kinase /adenosylcobinamide-phosphate guanylyltransferase [Streptosporangium subroseum]|uniref:Adenosylcobinamide kinase n=1 Tax=Streptosporangium subroseum TaxID=106412 RepID=A0A239A303_9ACTN|nr:bifunctional adenosylcobinamide kinase/adenosylcobinamide-phosphate guanylyltransferase [Streptosporangium subroseum]SNR89498.1 adenosylcobinamide kinase /adenosylcobinamide-phosphate guanylyltransferase [Streptosporangium subroseum]
MKVLISGTAGAGGWPFPGCGCASCARLVHGHRRPTAIVLADSVRLPLAGPLPSGYRTATGADGLTVTTPDGDRILYAAPLPASPPGRYGERTEPRSPALTDNRQKTPGQGAPTQEVHGQKALDLVLVDVLDRPERLGDLRRRGLVGERTHVVAVDIDHRVPTETELTRRAALWGVRAVPDGTVIDTREPVPPLPPLPRRTLLLGGSRSGKSAEAELRLAAEPEVLYVATGPSGGDDPEWRRRIDAHRDRRPAHWDTVETTDLVGLLRTVTTPMLIDGLGTWVAAVFDECDAWTDEGSTNSTYDKNSGNDGNDENSGTDKGGGNSGDARDAVTARCDELVAAWRQTRARVVAVSDEVGLGVVPATSSGRMFRDVLGRLNQRLALESEDVALVVSGRLLSLPI